MALAVPSLGVDQAVHAGAWKGIWWEKNTLGAMMAVGSVAALAARMNDPDRRWLWTGVAVLCTALVILSTSKTSLLAWVLGVGGMAGIALCRSGFGFAATTLFIGLTGGVLAALILLIAPLDALELLGRDATLTGRTDIWVVLIEQIRAAPWTGYGYKAYWAAENGPVFWVRQATAWDVPTAHNGWIELGLAVGLPGMAMMAFVYLRALFSALGRVFSGPETYFALPFVAMTGLISISESNLAQQNDLGWVLLVAVSAKLISRQD
ncbi:MAG: O-antigen ligase family protein [Alphaproteobacteria bacterium]|nr:O-antigen ligase family protein [Alphaproteobacteria bacterium]